MRGIAWLFLELNLQDTLRLFNCLSPTKICKLNAGGNNCNYIKDHKPIARSLNALYCNQDCFTNPTQRGNLMFKKNIEGYM